MAATEKPQKIYKFHKINPYLFNLLENGSLWFSHQNELNDPFDCKYALSDTYLMSILRSSTIDVLNDLKAKLPEFKDKTIDTIFNTVLPVIKDEQWFNSFYNMIFNDGGWSVCCFTTNPLNEMMWSHYAENHSGVCLEFDFNKDQQFLEKLAAVTYTDVFPEVNNANEIPKALLTKRQAWSQENEWRILSNVRGAKIFNKDCLTGIYFGYKVPKQVIERFKRTLNNSLYQGVNAIQIKLKINGFNFTHLDNL